MTCHVHGCDRARVTKLHCGMHHARWKRHGNTGAPGPILGEPADVFASKVQAKDSGCAFWIGGLTADGYGKFYTGGGEILAHRWAYLSVHGAIPDGLDLDHLCRNRQCVNPDHLEAVTRQVNTTRGVGFAGINARKTYCPQLHPYDGANLYVDPSGSRVCRTCKRDQARAYRARKASE